MKMQTVMGRKIELRTMLPVFVAALLLVFAIVLLLMNYSLADRTIRHEQEKSFERVFHTIDLYFEDKVLSIEHDIQGLMRTDYLQHVMNGNYGEATDWAKLYLAENGDLDFVTYMDAGGDRPVRSMAVSGAYDMEELIRVTNASSVSRSFEQGIVDIPYYDDFFELLNPPGACGGPGYRGSLGGDLEWLYPQFQRWPLV